MISSPHNEQLKTLRKLRDRRWRDKLGLFAAEGEDLVLAADEAGWEPELLLVAGEDVEPRLLAEASSLGSGARVVGVYRRRWSEPGGALSVYLHGVADPGNVGAVVRAGHALCDGPVVLGPGCADPWSPKAVRASMGSLFARPPARAALAELAARRLALDVRAETTLREAAAALAATPNAAPPSAAQAAPASAAQPGAAQAAPPSPRSPVVVLVGAERDGLPAELLEEADARARIPLREDGPESLGVAAAAAVALYEVANRMAGDA